MVFTIVGCGTIGSCIAYQLVLQSLYNFNINRLILIDNDCLLEKNLPYLIGETFLKDDINNPKSLVLKKMLSSINKNLFIEWYYSEYNNETNNSNFGYCGNIIDCRDTPEVLDNCFMKINIDGPYGLIMINPEQRRYKNKNSRYVYDNSQSYAPYLACICTQFLLDDKKYDNNQIYSVNFTVNPMEINNVSNF